MRTALPSHHAAASVSSYRNRVWNRHFVSNRCTANTLKRTLFIIPKMTNDSRGDYRGVEMADRAGAEPPKEQGDGDAICLKPKMGLLNGVTVIVGSIIGSGIFVSPKGVLLGTGSVGLSLVVWIVSGVFSMIGAFCYAELGCMITKSGADYAYIMESFGPFVAFIRLWVECMIVRPCSQAVVALTFSFYVLRPIFPDCEPPDSAVRMLAFLCICILTFINCWDVKWSMTVQNVFTFAKLAALVIIIITGIVQLGYGQTQHFNFEGSESDVTKIALSFYSGLFAYNGWKTLGISKTNQIE
ncbi:y+L amino acid transporter 2 [Caerostris darwini]|uniref:Y+L amino acid transporter 2 n=1 Tax=Caerostris darwini TaxID=1538125 RepID=A0AAV4QPT0_9ARAC|nr:y+L amino acid transporter 2 [Caerostris darwini]